MKAEVRLAAIRRRNQIVQRFAQPGPDFERSGIAAEDIGDLDELAQEMQSSTTSRAMGLRYHTAPDRRR